MKASTIFGIISILLVIATSHGFAWVKRMGGASPFMFHPSLSGSLPESRRNIERVRNAVVMSPADGTEYEPLDPLGNDWLNENEILRPVMHFPTSDEGYYREHFEGKTHFDCSLYNTSKIFVKFSKVLLIQQNLWVTSTEKKFLAFPNFDDNCYLIQTVIFKCCSFKN